MRAYSPWRTAALIRSASREVTMSRGILSVGPTLEISCEAPFWPGFVSFISLLDGSFFREHSGRGC